MPVTKNSIYIVSGLPRSGTSLMMQILAASDIALCTDGERIADESNEHGYFEMKAVKNLEKSNTWLVECRGKALKVISYLLPFLKNDEQYKVIFMRRDVQKIIQSQNRMLTHLGKPAPHTDNDKLAEKYTRHLREITAWVEAQKHMQLHTVEFENLFKDPESELERLNTFLEKDVPAEKQIRTILSSLKHF